MNKDVLITKLKQIKLELNIVESDDTGCADCYGCCNCCYKTQDQHERLQKFIETIITSL